MKVKQIENNRKQWDHDQYKIVYDAYLTFLTHQKAGEKYQKAATVRDVAEQLNRSKGSIECLMMNISAIHKLLGIEYVTGYKPLENYSHKLGAYVADINGFDYIPFPVAK